MNREIQLVVFDLAGTTVRDDDSVNRCFREALAGAGMEVSPAAVNSVMGRPKPEAIRWLIEQSPHGETLRARAEAIHADFVTRMRQFYAQDPTVCEIPGTSETFARLHTAGIKVAVNTGFSREITQVILDRMGWLARGLVDASVTSDEVPRGRPHPDMIRHLMASLGIEDAQAVAKVGDTPADLLEGTEAGCGLVIGVTQGTHTRQQLESLPHTHLIGTIAELLALLGI